jgi:predicted glycosyltransferase involved in capsule biosynthesis
MITFICHLRVDNDERLRNLQTILNYYSKYIPDSKFIIVEDDKTHNTKLNSLSWPKNTKLIFMENKSVWYKTKGLNIAAKHAESDIICQLDVDCIFNTESIIKTRDFLLANEDYQFAYPYNGYIIDLNYNFYRKFESVKYDYNFLLKNLPPINQLTLGYINNDISVRCTSDEHKGVGGIVMFKTDYYKKAGGYNEKFYCWGAEDNEIYERFEKLGYKHYRIHNVESIGFHLPHKNAIRHDNPFYQHNVNEFNKVKSLDKENLKKYISEWSMYV